MTFQLDGVPAHSAAIVTELKKKDFFVKMGHNVHYGPYKWADKI